MWRGLAGLMGAFILVGCGASHPRILGQPPEELPRSIALARSIPQTQLATVRGVMIQKCPAAGCWFILRDQTGTIKVDTKAAGFVVVDVPLQTTLTVTGKVMPDGDEKILRASGLCY